MCKLDINHIDLLLDRTVALCDVLGAASAAAQAQVAPETVHVLADLAGELVREVLNLLEPAREVEETQIKTAMERVPEEGQA
jgi:hypothetical protein